MLVYFRGILFAYMTRAGFARWIHQAFDKMVSGFITGIMRTSFVLYRC